MKLIYGIVGDSTQIIVESGEYSPNDTEVQMVSERPEPDMIATELGEWVKKEISLSELKEIKLSEVQKETADKITGGFICTDLDAMFDSDIDTQITMQGIALNVSTERFTLEYPLGCPCRGYREGSFIKEVFYLTPEQVLHFCADLSAHIGKCKQEGWEKQQKIIEVTTIEELEALYPKVEEPIDPEMAVDPDIGEITDEEIPNDIISKKVVITEDKNNEEINVEKLEELNVNFKTV